MDVILNRQRERVIKHQPYVRDVQSPGRHIRGHEHLGLSRFEACQSFESPLLRHITVKASNVKFLVAEIVFYSCSLSLVEDEDKNSVIFCG